MKNRRLAIVGLTLVTALGVAACGTDSGATSNNPTATGAAAGMAAPPAGVAPGSSEAAKKLAAAAVKLGETSFKADMDMSGALSMTGALDPKAGKANMEMSMGSGTAATTAKIVKVGGDLYLKFDGSLSGMLGKKWLHIDSKSLPPGSSFDIMPTDDAAGAEALIKSMAAVQADGANGFKGTVDMTKVPRYNKESIKALGAKATTVPFSATVDDQGRLTSTSIELSTVLPGAGTVTTKYSDFGTKVTAKAPAASDVSEVPKQYTSLLNA